MFGYELEGLKRLGVPCTKWGSNFRVKVLGRTKKMVYISNVSNKKNRELIAKQYKLSMKKLNTHLSPNYKGDPYYRFYQGKLKESHLYEDISPSEFYDKLETILSSQLKAFKIDIALGYELESLSDGQKLYWHPNLSNTNVFDKPITVNSKSDIRKKVISEIRTMELADRLKYPKSGYKLKAITGFRVNVYKRNYTLGDSAAVIPKEFRDSKHIINFPKTNNKCVFHCIAYHGLGIAKQNPRTIQVHVKAAFKKYCEFKNIEYSLSLFRNFKPIDIFHFDELEECFKLAINVYSKDVSSGEVKCERKSEKEYKVLNILSHSNHAMYIKNIDKFMSKYLCSKCEMIFATSTKLYDHQKYRCDETNIMSFAKQPTIYEPAKNFVFQMMQKYKVHDATPYNDHFIVYDFESILKPTNIQSGENTVFTNDHIPVSVSLLNTLSNSYFCIVEESPKRLIERMFAYIEKSAIEIQNYNALKYEKLLRKILAVECGPQVIDEIDAYIKSGHYSSFAVAYQNIEFEGPGDFPKLQKRLNQIPVLGFNAGKYDINLVKNEMFGVICDSVTSVIKNPGYMCISTKNYKMLDIANYVPAGTSLDYYCKSYLGSCKCKNKIRCICMLAKGIFPYEYITSFDVLNETELPPKSAFDSKLRGTSISDADYERAKFVWEHYNMKTIKDLLIWYNNLDVVPFALAIRKQHAFFTKYDLDMFDDGVSLPGLSEKIMYQTCFSNLKKKPRIPAAGFDFPIERFNGYKEQDAKAGREFDMTIGRVNTVMDKQKYLCSLCYCQLTRETASVDRINNKIGHTNDNFMITCIKCNVARKNMSIGAFRRKKLLEFNADRLVHSIDEEQKEIYHKMKANIAGGPSIIFNRYAKRNETKIRGGKLCMKIIGYDVNSLYLWCLGNWMPCGRLVINEVYEGIIDDIRSDKLFGFLECDIETPEHLKDYFSEMTPIFKNIEIDVEDETVIGKHMFEYNQERKAGGRFAKKSRKLIGSYFGKKILIYTPLLKWYLDHGLVITKTYSFIKANPHKAFEPFMEATSNARRRGDIEKKVNETEEEEDARKAKKLIGETMKLVGNSAFGRSGMDMTKHKKVQFMSDEEAVSNKIEHFTFHDLEEYNGAFEVTMKKRMIKARNPIHLSIAIYQLAKLRMLQFYYDCIDFYFDRSDFEYQEMDTDSAYIAFPCDNPFEECIKPELREHFKQHKHEWFPRDDTLEHAAYDRRTPGLLKEEWRGDAMVSLSSKNYICYLPDESHKVKISAKGVQQKNGKNSNVLNPECFESVVKDRITLQGTNTGFRVSKETKGMITYSQTKTALSYYYDKRQVCEDGIRTRALPI